MTQTLKQLLEIPALQTSLEASDFESVARYLNERPTIPNPAQRVKIIRFPAIEEIISLVPFEETYRIQREGKILDNVRDAIDARNYPTLIYNFKMLSSQQVELNITSSTLTALVDLLGTIDEVTGEIQPYLVDDPSYQDTVQGQSIAEQNELGIVTATHVLMAKSQPSA